MKNKKTWIIIGIVVIILIAIISFFVSNYNILMQKSENVDSSFAGIDVMLQRRADLIPNLVNTVKGYANHETEVINSITEARTKLMNANTVSEKAEADQNLNSALGSLMLVVENYPDLKSSANFIQLSDELAGTENRIAVARKDYNDTVKEYNLFTKRFPNSVIAMMFGYGEKDYFIASEGSQNVPDVNF